MPHGSRWPPCPAANVCADCCPITTEGASARRAPHSPVTVFALRGRELGVGALSTIGAVRAGADVGASQSLGMTFAPSYEESSLSARSAPGAPGAATPPRSGAKLASAGSADPAATTSAGGLDDMAGNPRRSCGVAVQGEPAL